MCNFSRGPDSLPYFLAANGQAANIARFFAGQPNAAEVICIPKASCDWDTVMIRVTNNIGLDESEMRIQAVRASGPGGQNVNKVATAVQLRFDARNSPSLPRDVRERLIRLAGRRATKEGELIIEAQRFRTQERNRQDATERLVEIIRRAAEKPKPRHATKPSAASRQRRLESKRRRSRVKAMRRPVARAQD